MHTNTPKSWSLIPRGDGNKYSVDNNIDSSFEVYSDEDYPPIPNSINPATERFFDGDALTDGDGTESNPWNDIQTVFINFIDEIYLNGAKTLTCKGTATLTADVVLKYSEPVSGSIGDPIIVRGHPDEGFTLNQSAGRIVFDEQKRWLIYGINGTVVDGLFRVGDALFNTNYFTFRNMNYTMTVGGDNVGVVYADGGLKTEPHCDYIGCFNLTIQGPGYVSGGVHGNTACIYISRLPKWRIENCSFGNAPVPLYYKHHTAAYEPLADQHFRYNYVYGDEGICQIAGTDGEYFSNIIECSFSFQARGGGDDGASNNVFKNNTVIGDVDLNTSDEYTHVAENNTLENNIMESNYDVLRYSEVSSTNTSDYTLLGGGVNYNYEPTQTLAQWQANSVPVGQDTHSLAGVPTFVGGSEPSSPAGYELTSSSLGSSAGSDGGNMGAIAENCGVKL